MADPFQLLFVPGGGGVGSGESFSCLTLARAARARWPSARVGFLLGEAHADVGFADFEVCRIAGRLSRNDTAVLEHLRATRPDVVLFDNRFVDGSSSPISRRDEGGNTFQWRQLESGDAHEVRKNFFRGEELRALCAPLGPDLLLRQWRYYWAVRFTVGEAA